MDKHTRRFGLGRDLLVGLVVGLLAVLVLRPARLRGVRVVRREDGPPARAEVGLEYTGGIRPVSVIIDLESAAGRGSATVAGAQSFAEVLLHSPLDQRCRVTATAAYRILGLLRTETRTFEV